MAACGGEADGATAPRFRPSFGKPGATFTYQPKGIDEKHAAAGAPRIPIALPDAPMYMLFAHRQWRAGMLLSDAIYSHAFDLDDKYVLELGAGTGLPALTAALCTNAKKVVATDYDDASIIAALRGNVSRTLAQNECKKAPIAVAPHTWGHAMDDVLDLLPYARGPTPKFDVILLADCVWERFSHTALVKSISVLLARSKTARVYMVAGLHTGRATLVHFFRTALHAGLRLEAVPGAWPQCEAAGDAYLPGSEHILELEVDGMLAEDSSDAQSIAPSLTGTRRPFTLPHDDTEAPIEQRNHWLTVSSFSWDDAYLA